MELINTHCHSFYCGHGHGQISEYVDEAKKAGLTTLAFTEHFPLSEAFDPDKYLSVPAELLDDYIEDVRRAQRENPDIEIILGSEFDYLGDLEDRVITEEDFGKFELVLGSVHFVDGWAFDDPSKRDVWEEEGRADEIWKRYFELWIDAVTDEHLLYDVMSHPDLPKKFAYYPSFDLGPWDERAAEACAQSGRMIEVNTSGGYYDCREMFPAREYLEAFRRANVPCTVGSDAHLPENVARDIEKGYKWLYDAGYREVTVPTRDGGRRTIRL
ncbi:MAG: histidinol-phosphatase [Eggerthellaceae bacterium]|nr:histidinol-phosphatase [Eggerthellaceae bacterium]